MPIYYLSRVRTIKSAFINIMEGYLISWALHANNETNFALNIHNFFYSFQAHFLLEYCIPIK